MQNSPNLNSDDEIDLRKLLIIIWAYKLFIAITCALGIVLSGYYALNGNKVFTSIAIFKLDTMSNKISLSANLSGLASLSGLSDQLTRNSLPTDQVTGRVFIEKLDTKLNFKADPYFNKYNNAVIDPIWKSQIKRAISWPKPSKNTKEVLWQGIVAEYTKNVALEETPDGSIRILVTHASATRAAKIANAIMYEIISSKQNKNNTEQDQQLSYLSTTLANAQADLKLSQSRLKKFALENSALPLENFTAGSLQLDTLREQLSRTSELHEAVAALLFLKQNKNTDQDSYLTLRQQFPIIDQVEFRRILGQSEIIRSWNWPETSTVEAILDTLSERKSRLKSQINISQIEAERSGIALEAYAKLEREAKLAEATYTILIEQVKAQSIIAGYRPDSTAVYEYASASTTPSAPNHILILTLGALLGLLVGTILSFVLAFIRGVYLSKNSIKFDAQARLTASVKNLMTLRNKSLAEINTMLEKNSRPALRDMAVEIHKSGENQVVVTSSNSKVLAKGAARALACYMASDTTKVAIIDFSTRANKLDTDNDQLTVGSYVVAERANHVSELRPNNDIVAIELLSQKDFWKNIQSLKSTFDLVFLCADNNDAISLLNILEGGKTFHITLARSKHTKFAVLTQMRTLLPIKGLFYD